MGDSTRFRGGAEKQSDEDDAEAAPKIVDQKPRGLWQQLNGDSPARAENRPRGMWDWVNSRANGDAVAADPTAVANAGVQSANERMPHHDQIQASFGRHNILGVRAQTGGGAAEASRGLGASAYAVDDRVGFAQSPDLHTAAHEAAHVVQQRGGVQLKGGIDRGKGDPYEQHANAVADKVVRGESSEGLLDTMMPRGGPRSAASAGAVQRAPDQSQQAPGASITVTLFDANKAFITSRTEPLFSEGGEGSYIGEIQGETITWDGGSVDVKLGSKVEAGGKLSGAMSVGAWAKQAGHGRAHYVLVEVDAAQLRTKDATPDAKPWEVDDDAAGAQRGVKNPASGTGDDPNATSSHAKPGKGGASDGSGGADDKTVAGMQDGGDHTGTSAIQNGEKGGTRVMGQRSKGVGDGTRHGTKGAQKRDVGYFWDPDRQHGGSQDTAPDGAEKEGMVGGAGKHGDHGIPDVGAWKAKIPIPKRFAAAATAAMILYQANIQQIAKDLIKAAEKTAEAELKAFALSEIEKLAGSEMRHLAEKGALEGMDDAALAAAQQDVRNRIVQRLAAELEAETANAEKAAAIDRAESTGKNARYAAEDLKDEQDLIGATKRARDAVTNAQSAGDVAAAKAASAVDEATTRLRAAGLSEREITTTIEKFGANGIDAVDRLVKAGVSPANASMVLQVAERGGVGSEVLELINAGRLRNANGFKAFLEKLEREVNQGARGKVNELLEATRRSNEGHEVSLGGSKFDPRVPESGQADIVQYGADAEAVQMKTVSSAQGRTAADNLNKSIRQLKGETGELPPISAKKVAKIIIDNPKNEWYLADRAQLVRIMKRDVTALASGDAIEIQIQNGIGQQTIAASEIVP